MRRHTTVTAAVTQLSPFSLPIAIPVWSRSPLMKTDPSPHSSPSSYRSSRGSLIPPHIAQTRWRETSAILGSVVVFGAAGIFLATRPGGSEAGLKKTSETADRPPELVAESAHTTLAAAITATVPVKVHVEASGEVSETKIEQPTPALAALEARALAAARSYRYKAGLKAG